MAGTKVTPVQMGWVYAQKGRIMGWNLYGERIYDFQKALGHILPLIFLGELNRVSCRYHNAKLTENQGNFLTKN